MTEREYMEQRKAELLVAIQANDRPTHGHLAVQVWEYSTHAPLDLAKSLMHEAGYKLWVGYPLQRCSSQR